MPKLVAHGASLKCSEGTSPGMLAVVPSLQASGDLADIATVTDCVPLVHIPAFGMCKTQSNPQVAAATAAASGVLTPMPCLPVITGPWSPGSDAVTFGLQSALTKGATCTCAWAGTIEVTDPGSTIDVE
ncbi:MAG: DUF4280 domain-containing protein [Polyangiaceae bacterium]